MSPQDGWEEEVRHEKMLGSRKTALVRDGKLRKNKGHVFVLKLLCQKKRQKLHPEKKGKGRGKLGESHL